jgi:RecA/RadA recombinase
MAAKKKKSAAKAKTRTKREPTPKRVMEGWPSRNPSLEPIEDRSLVGSELRTKLRAFKGKVNEEAGRPIIGFASEAVSTYLLRRPFGITDLDLSIGGGAPAGGPIQIAGPDGSGKTYLAMQCMRMHQLIRGPACSMMYVCAEPALGFDFKRAAKMGLKVGLPKGYIPQVQKMRVDRGLEPLTDADLAVLTEQVGELMIVQAHTGEEALETVLRGVESGMFGIIIIDSLTNLIPSANADKYLDEEKKRAARATLITDFVAQYTPMVNKFGEPNYTTLIGIAQARANPKQTEYTKEWEIPIAWSWKHAVLQNILVWNGRQIKKTRNKVERTVGKAVHWSIAKAKAGSHEHAKGEYDFFFDDVFPDAGFVYGADRAETMLVEGMRAGIIREYQSKIVLVRACDGVAFMDGIPGLPTLKQMIDADFQLEQLLRQEIMAARGIECRYL